jgi:alkanesulfonate monooxygenase SsuD/methylene tetrahydromethanopterin reductase-like flavin-dependent oxidoreductase (luciferase family)
MSDHTVIPLGLTTLGDHLPDPRTGERITEEQRFGQFVDLGVVADDLGFAAYHVGEHHFCDYVLSSPAVVLAAVAARTRRVRLSTAVSLLPHLDPVRVAEDYATLDVLSGGRAELLAGRGVFQQHYAHFGQDPAHSEHLLEEAVDLLRRLWSGRPVTWQGSLRPPLDGVTVFPRPLQRPHVPVYLSASSLTSVARAVALGCPIAIATISTGPDLPAQLAAAYRTQWADAGRDPAEAAVILHVHAYVGGGTTGEAADRWMPHQTSYLRWVLDTVRGPTTPMPPPWQTVGRPESQAICGSVDDVAAEIARRLAAVGPVERLLVQTDQGALPFDEVTASMERLVTRVAPQVADRLTSAASAVAL